ncbi:MAG TPA: acyltransferase [Jatrophihabitans sp.]|nr:acyltransferase [Jatrophihabitans sp.]
MSTPPPAGPTRAPDQERRFPALYGMRAVAALGIVATHAGFASGRSLHNDLLAAVLGRLDFGVALFFVISGLVLYRPFVVRSLSAVPDPAVGSFWLRRLVRILPALWLMVAVTLGAITTRSVSVGDWLHYLLLIQVYDHHELDPNFSQLWTLSAELAFYAMLPLVAAAVRRSARTPTGRLRSHLIVVAGLAGTALVFNIVQAHLLRNSQALLWAPCYLDWFALGMLLAVLSAASPTVLATLPVALRLRTVLVEWASSPFSCWLAAAVIWLLSTTQVATPRTVAAPTFWQWTIQHYLFGAAAVLVFIPLVYGSGGRVGAMLSSGVGAVLGQWSYSIYLWHLPLLLLIQRELDYAAFSGHFLTLLLLTTVATLVVAALSWYGLERPLLRYDSRRRRRHAGRPTAAVSTTAEIVNS